MSVVLTFIFFDVILMPVKYMEQAFLIPKRYGFAKVQLAKTAGFSAFIVEFEGTS